MIYVVLRETHDGDIFLGASLTLKGAGDCRTAYLAHELKSAKGNVFIKDPQKWVDDNYASETKIRQVQDGVLND